MDHYEKLKLQFFLKDSLKACNDFKSKKKVNKVMFLMYKCMYIVYSIHYALSKIQMLKKLSFNKINGTKNALLFLSRAPTHDHITFNLRFLYELKHKVRLPKGVCRIFYFRFCFV